MHVHFFFKFLNVSFMWKVMINFVKKSGMLQHLLSNFRSIIYQVVAYKRWKTRENFKLVALKVVVVAYERCLLTVCLKHTVVIWRESFWYFGKLLAEERWSLLEVQLYKYYWDTLLQYLDIASHFVIRNYLEIHCALCWFVYFYLLKKSMVTYRLTCDHTLLPCI